MKFSTKTRYGIRTMLEIAADKSDKGVFQKDIAASQEISVKYLDHIIHALKAAGLITTLRGKKSGYVLTRKPSEITMFDIHNAFENGISVIDCVNNNFICERHGKCSSQPFWKGLNKVVSDYFHATSLEDLLQESSTTKL